MSVVALGVPDGGWNGQPAERDRGRRWQGGAPASPHEDGGPAGMADFPFGPEAPAVLPAAPWSSAPTQNRWRIPPQPGLLELGPQMLAVACASASGRERVLQHRGSCIRGDAPHARNSARAQMEQQGACWAAEWPSGCRKQAMQEGPGPRPGRRCPGRGSGRWQVRPGAVSVFAVVALAAKSIAAGCRVRIMSRVVRFLAARCRDATFDDKNL